ncbi:MAG: hypothetical protein IID37_05255 [Planctomycetes bacterium]|nr:hypothetical protein [Planctomycetota bacterium]
MQTGRQVSWTCLLGLAMAANALGQSQDGRALDASLEVYSSGINPEIEVFDFGAANRLVTGNVTGGRSFQGFSPVGSERSLMMGIPSSSLSTFRRDSFSLSNLTSTGFTTQPFTYFAPERTATTLGAIQAGVNLPGSTYARAALTLPRFDLAPTGSTLGTNPYFGGRPALEPFSLRPMSIPLEYKGLWLTPDSVLSPVRLDRRDGDSAFDERPSGTLPLVQPMHTLPITRGADLQEGVLGAGFQDGLRGSDLLQLSYEELQARTALSVSPTLTPDYAPASRPFADLSPVLSPVDLANPLAQQMLSPDVDTLDADPVQPAAVWTTPLVERISARAGPGGAVQRGRVGSPEAGSSALAGLAGVPSDAGTPTDSPLIGEALLSTGFAPDGQSPFANFQRAVEFLAAYEEHRQVLGSKASTDAGPPDVYRGAADAARTFVDTPLASYAGRDDTLVNRYVLRAEAFLKAGEFYQAVSMYKVAAAFSGDDPLIDIGLGHAFLGAGDYLSAFLYLEDGIELFDSIACFRIDLSKFLTDPILLDIRRSELEKRLAEDENYELRFLLGYAEYYSGLQRFGLENLKKAAALAPDDSIVARFPDLLAADCAPQLEVPD